jgi:putative cell wall-binding protein
VLAAQQDGPLLIATPDELSWPTSDWLTDHDPDDVFFIGGPDVVSGAPAYEYEALR